MVGCGIGLTLAGGIAPTRYAVILTAGTVSAECSNTPSPSPVSGTPTPKPCRSHFLRQAADVLIASDFDRFAEMQCASEYSPRHGRPSLPPGYFRMLLVGYFEGIDSERGLEWRAPTACVARIPPARRARARAGSLLAEPHTRSRLPLDRGIFSNLGPGSVISAIFAHHAPACPRFVMGSYWNRDQRLTAPGSSRSVGQTSKVRSFAKGGDSWHPPSSSNVMWC